MGSTGTRAQAGGWLCTLDMATSGAKWVTLSAFHSVALPAHGLLAPGEGRALVAVRSAVPAVHPGTPLAVLAVWCFLRMTSPG